ncbi:MAG TPA: hypothetical protein VGC41_10540, partial [Kofleriaceae bacterium]
MRALWILVVAVGCEKAAPAEPPKPAPPRLQLAFPPCETTVARLGGGTLPPGLQSDVPEAGTPRKKHRWGTIGTADKILDTDRELGPSPLVTGQRAKEVTPVLTPYDGPLDPIPSLLVPHETELRACLAAANVTTTGAVTVNVGMKGEVEID